MDNTTVIDRIVAEDKAVYSATMAIIESMATDTNKAMDDLTDEVSEVVSRDATDIKALVSHFAKATEADGIGYVAPGRFGGYRKGQRPVKKGKKTEQESN